MKNCSARSRAEAKPVRW